MFNEKTAGVIAAVLVFCAAAVAAEKDAPLEEIGVFGPYRRASRLVCDRGGETWAFAAEDNRSRLYIVAPAGTRGPLENWLDVAVTGDGSKIVYTNLTNNGDYYIGVGEEVWGPFEFCASFARDIVSPRGSSWGCWVRENGKAYALINGEMWGPYERMYQVSFSADGSSWGFKACDGGKWFGIVNGKKVGYHDEPYQEPAMPDPIYESPAYAIVFSGDGAVWGFPGYKRDKRGDLNSYIIINGTDRGPLPGVGDLAISLDGSVWGITVGPQAEAGAIINGKKWPPEGGYIKTHGFRVSDYNGSWAFAAEKEDGWYAIVNGEENGPFIAVYKVVFSEDGRVWGATIAQESGKPALLINGVAPENLTGYSYLRFSPSGNTWTARTRRENGFYRRVDGVDYGPYGYDGLSGEIVFSADGNTWVIGGGYGPVVVNGEEFGIFGDAALFTSDTETGFFALEETENGNFRLLRWNKAAGLR